MLKVKNLLTVHTEDEVPVKTVTIRKIPRFVVKLCKYQFLKDAGTGHKLN